MRIADLGKKAAAVLQALVLTFGFGMGSLALAGPVLAADTTATCSEDLTIDNGAACAKATSAREGLFAPGGIFSTIANTLIFLVGAISVIMLIVGGLRYVVSNGDAKAVEGAKNTILYSIVGVVIAVISFALIQFVISALNKSGS